MYQTRMIATALFAAHAVFALPITVLNPSFETFNALNNACAGADCAFNVAAVPDWQGGFVTGSFRPGTNTLYFDSLPDGIIVGYASDGALSQTVSETVQDGVTYTLLVDLGNRKDLNPFGSISLTIGGNAPIFGTGPAIPEGGFATYTVSYTGIPADIGKSIQISLFAGGTGAFYDNVRLSNSLTAPEPIPEPSSIALTAMGCGLLAVVRKRRRR